MGGGGDNKVFAASKEAIVAMVTLVTWQLSYIILATCCLSSGAKGWL